MKLYVTQPQTDKLIYCWQQWTPWTDYEKCRKKQTKNQNMNINGISREKKVRVKKLFGNALLRRNRPTKGSYTILPKLNS